MNRQIFKGIDINDAQVFETLEKQFNANRSEVLATVPWLVAELIEAVGFKTTMKFIDKSGGKKIHINKDRLDLARKLGFAITEELYDKIRYLACNEYLEIPSTWGVFEKIRSALVKSAVMDGKTREEIRSTYGVSSRFLTKIFNGKSDNFRKACTITKADTHNPMGMKPPLNYAKTSTQL